MPRVADLSMIERRYAHEGAGCNGYVVAAAGIEPTGYLQRPSSRCPARGTANIGAITRVRARDNHPWHHGTNRDFGVELA